MVVMSSISIINIAIDTPTAIPTTGSSSSSSGAVDCIEIYSLSTISGPSFYDKCNLIMMMSCKYQISKYSHNDI